jgi:hypothetical protein
VASNAPMVRERQADRGQRGGAAQKSGNIKWSTITGIKKGGDRRVWWGQQGAAVAARREKRFSVARDTRDKTENIHTKGNGNGSSLFQISMSRQSRCRSEQVFGRALHTQRRRRALRKQRQRLATAGQQERFCCHRGKQEASLSSTTPREKGSNLMYCERGADARMNRW